MKATLDLGRWLLREAVGAIAPFIGGCAGVLIGRQLGHSGMGRALGGGIERALDYFGKRIVERWLQETADQPAEERQRALEELAALPPEEARRETAALLDDLHLSLIDEDREVALDYLTAIPQILSRTLAHGTGTGRGNSVAADSFADAASLLRLLPRDVPPYAAPCAVPGTTYRLEALVGAGGFGTVYRAVDPKMPYMPLAIKFCRDPSAAPVLRRERDNLERMIHADTTGWSPRVVRFYGYDLDHATPFLVYEFVPGGDLASAVAQRAERPPLHEVLGWMRGIAEGLAFVHRHRIVHRDLKPANVLLAPDGTKLTDFGIGGTAALEGAAAGTMSQLRGAGTPLYMAPEQRRGAAPDPRHDIYSAGVIWYQLLLGDCSAELHPGWEEELREVAAPEAHVELIRRCVGPAGKRPADGSELLGLLSDPEAAVAADAAPPQLVALMRQLRASHEAAERATQPTLAMRAGALLAGLAVAFGVLIALGATGALLLETFNLMRGPGTWLMPTLAILSLATGIALGTLVYRRIVLAGCRRQVAQQRRALELQADVLADLFPEATTAWGGRPALVQKDTVERLSRQLDAQATMTPRDRQRLLRWKPASQVATVVPEQTDEPVLTVLPAPPPTVVRAPARTSISATNINLLRRLVDDYGAALDEVASARPTPKKTKWQIASVAVYGFLIPAGLIIPLPVIMVSLYVDGLYRVMMIVFIAVVGSLAGGMVSLFLSRWFWSWQRRARLKRPLEELSHRADLLHRAFPREIDAWGGHEALLDSESGETIYGRLMGMVG